LDCALELALISPFEVINETGATLALSASLDRALVLLLPPRRPGKGARAVLGSWGTDFIPHGLIHSVRVAAAAPVAEAEERAEGDEGSSSLASLPPLLQPPKITSPEEGPLDWSPFLQVSKPACVTLGAEMGEVLRVVLIPQERRVHGWVQRTLIIRPSMCVHNRTLQKETVIAPDGLRLPPSSGAFTIGRRSPFASRYVASRTTTPSPPRLPPALVTALALPMPSEAL
jgi:hypothetical protein